MNFITILIPKVILAEFLSETYLGGFCGGVWLFVDKSDMEKHLGIVKDFLAGVELEICGSLFKSAALPEIKEYRFNQNKPSGA